MKVQVSPGLASPSPPSEQSISPLSGAVSGGHVTTVDQNTYQCKCEHSYPYVVGHLSYSQYAI